MYDKKPQSTFSVGVLSLESLPKYALSAEIAAFSYLRPHCNCMESVDIGHYSTCGNGCLYCYATPERPNMTTDPECRSLDPGFDLQKIASSQLIDLRTESHRTIQMQLF